MPKLRGYEQRSEVSGPVNQRRASTDDFSMARGINQVGEAAGVVGDVIQRRQEQAEISDLSAKIAAKRAEHANRWRDTIRTADPADSEISSRFLTEFDEDIAKLSEGVSTAAGKSFFQKTVAGMRADFQESTYAGQVELAGVKARQDYEVTENSLSSALLADPSSFDSVIAQHTVGVDEMVKSRGLPSSVAEQLRTQGSQKLAKAALRGWIDINPDEAKNQIASGKWDTYLGGEEKAQMFGLVDQEIRGRELEQERQRKEQERQRKERQLQVQNDFLERMTQGKLTTKEILRSDLEAFGSGSKDQFLDMLKQSSERQLKTDPGTYRELFSRIHAPDSDPKKIWDENELNQFFGKGLSMEDLGQLRKEIQGGRTTAGRIENDQKNDVLKHAAGMLSKSNPMTGFKDPIGDEQLMRFTNWFNQEYQEQRKKGKTSRELTDPDSPDYLGKGIRRFVRSNDQIMQDMIRMNTQGLEDGGLASTPNAGAPAQAPTPPASDKARKPGETIQQWRERTKAGS